MERGQIWLILIKFCALESSPKLMCVVAWGIRIIVIRQKAAQCDAKLKEKYLYFCPNTRYLLTEFNFEFILCFALVGT